jgi:hypothetical protein
MIPPLNSYVAYSVLRKELEESTSMIITTINNYYSAYPFKLLVLRIVCVSDQ